METLWCPLTLLLLLAQLQPSHTHQKLSCLNDYINNLTCVWDSKGVPPDTACTLHGVHHGRSSECKLKPLDSQNQARRGCHLFFVKRSFSSYSVLPLQVNCENRTVDQINDYKPYLHVKLNPPGMPTIDNYNISWSPSSPFSKMVEYTFQAQFKQNEQQWEQGVELTRCAQPYFELNDGLLVKGERYQVRVRVGVLPESIYKGEWSLWSPVASWRSEVGKERTREVTGQLTQGLVIGCIAGLLVLLGVISILATHRCVHVASCKAVPDPSKYFDALITVHSGNFQKWLSPMFATESFDVIQRPENISPVRVSSMKDTDSLFRKESATAPEQLDSSGQSSSFSNIGYFCSSYPYEIERCPVYFSYQPEKGTAKEGKDGAGVVDGNGPIETCSSYECLQKLINCHRKQKDPDSGFDMALGSNLTSQRLSLPILLRLAGALW
ncbi:hypothetical protein AAFF_G00296270 [Aldrovandia affinis]|uniref:Interleukin-2 receptor subunit beta n=1 Tax=Aldrovandia affinis TaxID=143900 RepID=A0AAD7SQE4_9TELE|nr:hypothetical protein AAFF_G00296270 [Aldrovandia affinis]